MLFSDKLPTLLSCVFYTVVLWILVLFFQRRQKWECVVTDVWALKSTCIVSCMDGQWVAKTGKNGLFLLLSNAYL